MNNCARAQVVWKGVLQNHRSPTGHRPPTNDPPTGPPPTYRPPTHRKVLHRPTNHRPTDKCSTNPPTTDQPTSVPPTHRPPTHRQVLHRPANHRLTDSPILLQLANNPLTCQSYFNRVTIGSILSATNSSSSFGMSTIYYWNGKSLYKMTDKKERWYITNFVYRMKTLEAHIIFPNHFSFEKFLFFSLGLMLQNIFH